MKTYQFTLLLMLTFLQPLTSIADSAYWIYAQGDFDRDKQKVVLSWDMLKADDAQFLVERSFNNLHSFESIGVVAARDERSGDYRLEDNNLPLVTTLVYYRIQMQKDDKPLGESEIVLVRVEGMQALTGPAWRVSPNPIINNNVRLVPLEAKYIQQGKTLLTIMGSFNGNWKVEASDLAELNLKLEFLMPQLPKGLLVFQIENSAGIERLKVIKL